MTIKAITFDFWSTLYTSKTTDYTERLRLLKTEVEEGSGVDFEQDQFEAAVKAAREIWRRTWLEDYRTIDAEEWLDIVLKSLDVSLNSADLLKIQTRIENTVLNDRPVLVGEAHTVLADLSTHYKLAIISDTGLTPGRTLRQVLESDHLTGYFTHLTFSDEIGRSKPHPDAFLTTLDALDVKPAEAVHIGDLLRTDIAGAQNVGMRGVQYTGLNHDQWSRAVDAPVAGIVTPDAVIDSHTELAALIKRWNNSI